MVATEQITALSSPAFTSDYTDMFTAEEDTAPPPDFATIFLDPKGPLTWALLLLSWSAAIAYALLRMRLIRVLHLPTSRHRQRQILPFEHRESIDNAHSYAEGQFDRIIEDLDRRAQVKAAIETQPATLSRARLPRRSRMNRIVITEMLWLIPGLIFAAIWPWVFRGHVLSGFLLALAMLCCILTAALTRRSHGARRRASPPLGILAGWATLVSCAAFATLLESDLGVSSVLAGLLFLLICAVTAANVQLHLGAPISYSVTVTLGLFGVALSTISADPAIATAAVLAITFVIVALVRVST